MSEERRVFVFISPDILDTLLDNNVDLLDLLRNEGIEPRKALELDPAAIGEKEPATVLIASAALIVSLSPIIARVIQAITSRKVVVREVMLVPVEDSSGNVVKDSRGEPLLQWVVVNRMLESTHTTEQSSFQIKGPLGLQISYQSSNQG